MRTINRARCGKTRDAQGFSLVEGLVSALLVGILVAVVVFAVGAVSNHPKKVSCAEEVRSVRTAIATFKTVSPTHKTPASLNVLVAAKLLKKAPSPATASGALGYFYNPADGTYSGPPCPPE